LDDVNDLRRTLHIQVLVSNVGPGRKHSEPLRHLGRYDLAGEVREHNELAVLAGKLAQESQA
jgi:hypothetical protein